MPAPTSTAGPAHTLLVIDDEPQIRRAVKNALEDTGDRIVEAATGREGLTLAASARPDLVVLDLGLPDMDGIAVCRELRRSSQMPVVVLSARHSDEEKVALLDAGADDYVTKPFSLREFAARVRAQLRRALLAEATLVSADDLTIDLGARRVTRAEHPIHLTPIEFEILRALIRHAGRTLTHQQLFAAVWGQAAGNAQQYLRVHITNLRRKIERDASRPQLIVTDPGAGYRFELPTR
jgi:two-component system KDP operon response regulator KdpE